MRGSAPSTPSSISLPLCFDLSVQAVDKSNARLASTRSESGKIFESNDMRNHVVLGGANVLLPLGQCKKVVSMGFQRQGGGFVLALASAGIALIASCALGEYFLRFHSDYGIRSVVRYAKGRHKTTRDASQENVQRAITEHYRRIAAQLASPVPTILAVGDSITAGGPGLPNGEAKYTAVLERLLRAQGYPHQVIPFGIGGTAVNDQIGIYRAVKRRKFSAVILQICNNDFYELSRLTRSSEKYWEYRQIRDVVPLLPAFVELPGYTSLLASSLLAQAVNDASYRVVVAINPHVRKSITYAVLHEKKYADSLQVFLELVGNLPLVMVYFPAIFHGMPVNDVADRGEEDRRISAFLSKQALRYEKPLVDLLPVYARLGHERIFLRDDIHPNALAHSEAGRLLFDVLHRQRMLK